MRRTPSSLLSFKLREVRKPRGSPFRARPDLLCASARALGGSVLTPLHSVWQFLDSKEEPTQELPLPLIAERSVAPRQHHRQQSKSALLQAHPTNAVYGAPEFACERGRGPPPREPSRIFPQPSRVPPTLTLCVSHIAARSRLLLLRLLAADGEASGLSGEHVTPSGHGGHGGGRLLMSARAATGARLH